MYVCVKHLFVCVCTCVGLFLSSFTLLIEAKSLLEPKAHQFALVCWPSNQRIVLSPLKISGVRERCKGHHSQLCVFERDPKSGLFSKHFTSQDVSSGPGLLFLNTFIVVVELYSLWKNSYSSTREARYFGNIFI